MIRRIEEIAKIIIAIPKITNAPIFLTLPLFILYLLFNPFSKLIYYDILTAKMVAMYPNAKNTVIKARITTPNL